MPWCEPCSQWWSPNALRTDGSCPRCGMTVAEPQAPPRAPWHFKVLVGATALYLGWRAVQMIGWLVR